MNFAIESDHGVEVVAILGDLWGGEDTFQMKFKIKEATSSLIEDGKRRFVIDLKKVKRVNSTGIGVLVAVHASIKNAGGEVKVCEVAGKTRTALVVTGVKQLFDIYETRDAAVTAFVGEHLAKTASE